MCVCDSYARYTYTKRTLSASYDRSRVWCVVRERDLQLVLLSLPTRVQLGTG